MKIVQTLWTKPGLRANWIDKRFHFMSWALSCLQLRQFYDEVELYTDDNGKKLLIDIMGLPYTKVHLTLNELDLPNYLWAIPKIHTYSLQEAPFLHVDGDVFIWKRFDEEKAKAPFVCQNLELENGNASFYSIEAAPLVKALRSNGQALPDWMAQLPMHNIAASNAGVYGGHAFPLFKQQAAMSFDFIKRFRNELDAYHRADIANHFCEQVLPHYLMPQHGLAVTSLFEPIYFDEAAKFISEFRYIDRHGISPHNKRKYIHLVGWLKNDMLTCKMLEMRLRTDYPLYYERIFNRFGSKPIVQAKGNSRQPDPSKGVYEQALAQQIADTFRRTTQVMELFGITDFPDTYEAFVNAMPHIAAQIENDRKREQLLDCFELEKQRYEFALTIDNNEAYTMAENPFGNNAVLLTHWQQLDLESYVIRFNTCYKIVYNRWVWTDRLVEAALGEEPDNWQTILAADTSVTNYIYEFSPSKLQQIILFAFSIHHTYSAALAEIRQFIDGPMGDDLLQKIFKNVVLLANLNILTVCKSSEGLNDNMAVMERTSIG
jgi:hypothetical protein